MSAAALTLRIMLATVIMIVVVVTGIFGYIMIEPISAALGGPPAALNWGDPGFTTITFMGVGFGALLLVLIIWFIAAPIRSDQRQQFR